MTLIVDVEDREDDEWVAVVRDDEYPGLIIGFEYWLGDEHLFRSGFSVRWDPEAGRHSEISLYEIRRDFPVAVWERAAQGHIVDVIQQREEEYYGEPAAPVATPSSSEEGLPRLLLIAVEYKKNINEGIADPVAAIAKSHGVKPETARSWVHRARNKGYLGPTDAGKAGVSPRPSTSVGREAKRATPGKGKTRGSQ